jgi:Mn-dependent DtxR family transcriptional regulator
MSQKRQTPDERFLIQLYETASAAGNPFAEIDPLGIARAVGLKETALKNIVKHLAQANFVKKTDERTLCLTERGRDFVLDAMQS